MCADVLGAVSDFLRDCHSVKPLRMKLLQPALSTHLQSAAKQFGTPLHVYDESAIIHNAKHLMRAFSWNKGFKEYFAVKATPNPFIMRVLRNEGLGMDCSSLAELELCKRCDISGESIMFTSNNTPIHEYAEAKALGAYINLDDLSHLEYLHNGIGIPDAISFRLNPGEALGGSEIIGKPEEAKFGLTREQLMIAYRQAKELGVQRFGLHTMPISNQLEEGYFAKTVRLLLDVVCEVKQVFGISIEFINMGGGIGIPYRPEEQPVDIERISSTIKATYEEMLSGQSIEPPRLFMECGRYITGPYGYLITKVIHKKDIYRKYIGVDATMADLMRPGMYGAYHHITVLGKETSDESTTYDVVGSLCENNDKFAVQRLLPPIEIGDTLVIHDTGAHGHAMGFNYNGKLRSAEVMLRPDGTLLEIRRRETLEDHFRTLSWDELKSFAV